jgi:hypothetical protein
MRQGGARTEGIRSKQLVGNRAWTIGFRRNGDRTVLCGENASGLLTSGDSEPDHPVRWPHVVWQILQSLEGPSE